MPRFLKITALTRKESQRLLSLFGMNRLLGLFEGSEGLPLGVGASSGGGESTPGVETVEVRDDRPQVALGPSQVRPYLGARVR